MKDCMPVIEWRHTCLNTVCGAVFIALLQEAVCRICGSTRLSKHPIIRKILGGCIPEGSKNPLVERFDPDDD